MLTLIPTRKRAAVLCVLLFLSGLTGRAQTSCVIRGRVTDAVGSPLSRATVGIWQDRDSTFVLTKEDGGFEAHNLRCEPFRVRITMKGYVSYERSFEAPPDQRPLVVPPIILQPQFEELGAVTIGHLRSLSVKADTMTYYAGAWPLREGSFLGDLIRQLPGLNLADSGLIAMGKKVTKLLLDGKAFYGKDVQTALKSLPYDLIDKVEVIDDYGDDSRLTGLRTRSPDKVLNITLKKDKDHVFTASLEGGAGDGNRYISDISCNLFQGKRKLAFFAGDNNNGDFGPDWVQFLRLNYADEWGRHWSSVADASLYHEDNVRSESLIQDNYYNTGTTHLEQNSKTHQQIRTQSGSYEVLSQTDQIFRLSGLFNRQFTDQQDQVDITSLQKDSAFSKKTTSTTIHQLNSDDLKSETNIYYGKTLPGSNQRFSIEGGLIYSGSTQRGEDQTLSQIIADSQQSNVQQYYRIFNQTKSLDGKGNFRWYFPIGKKGLIETRYGLHATHQQNVRDWKTPDPTGSWRQLDSLSSDFTYRTTEQLVYGGYGHHDPKTDLSLGLTIDPGTLTGVSSIKNTSNTSHYLNVLPEAAFSYALKSTKKIAFNYSTDVTLPTLQQVTPVTDVSIPQYPVTGNPYLKPAVKQSAGLQYEENRLQGGQYFALAGGLTYSFTQNQITPNFVHPRDTGTVIQQTYYVNINGAHDLLLNYRVDIPLVKNWRLSGIGRADISRGITIADSIRSAVRTLTTMQYITLQYALPARFDIKGTFEYDYSNTSYLTGDGSPFSSTKLTFRIDQNAYLYQRWQLGYIFVLIWNNINGGRLQQTPAWLNATLSRSFLKHNQLTFTIAGTNLLNAQTGFAQANTPTSITQYKSSLVGRRLLFSVKLSFEKFSKKIVNPTK